MNTLDTLKEEEKEVNEVLNSITSEYGHNNCGDGCSNCLVNFERLRDYRRKIYQQAVEDRKERIGPLLSELYSTLLKEFVDTGLATEEQWNESVSVAMRRLGNVISGLDPESPTARVYKYPHESVRGASPQSTEISS